MKPGSRPRAIAILRHAMHRKHELKYHSGDSREENDYRVPLDVAAIASSLNVQRPKRSRPSHQRQDAHHDAVDVDVRAIAPATTRRCTSFRCGITIERTARAPLPRPAPERHYTARTNVWWNLSTGCVGEAVLAPAGRKRQRGPADYGAYRVLGNRCIAADRWAGALCLAAAGLAFFGAARSPSRRWIEFGSLELATLRSEYHAAAGAAFRVAVAALLALGVALIFVDGRRTALALVLGAAFAAFIGFATYFAVHRALTRLRSGLVTVAPPTLVTRIGVLEQRTRRPPLHASHETDAETRRRHVRIAVPGIVGFCSAIAVVSAGGMGSDGTRLSTIVMNALAIASGQATGLTLIHLVSERWVSRWEKQTALVLLRDTERSSTRRVEPLYAETRAGRRLSGR